MIPLYRPTAVKYPITQAFGPTENVSEPPLDHWPHFHRGVDYAVPLGTALFASGDGTVVFSGWDDTGYGLSIVVDHGLGLRSRVAHLQSIGVSVGTRVWGGSPIGMSGTTGNSTGPHVHWELTENGWPIHPALLVAERGR